MLAVERKIQHMIHKYNELWLAVDMKQQMADML